MTLSLCMIVKDEEAVLGRCLESVATCIDEFVIVDTGSTDKTKEIAARYAPPYAFAWNDDFAAARNFAFSKASKDYILWLDADDYVSPENAARLLTLKHTLGAEMPDMVMCPYDTGRQGGTTFYRERILRRESNFVWQGRVHECIAPRGKLFYSDFRVTHLSSNKDRSWRNLNVYLHWAEEERLGGRDLFYFGRELYYHRLYTQAIAVLSEMLDGEGWYVNKIEACKILAQCHLARGNREVALAALARSFGYGEPRASVLCEMGHILKENGDLAAAAFWYESALNCRDHSAEGDFEEPLCRNLIPLLQLTCCYYALGNHNKARAFHEKAKALFPDHPSVQYNDKFFNSHPETH